MEVLNSVGLSYINNKTKVIYLVIGVTNQGNKSKDYPPHVIYVGENGSLWSCTPEQWEDKIKRKSIELYEQ